MKLDTGTGLGVCFVSYFGDQHQEAEEKNIIHLGTKTGRESASVPVTTISFGMNSCSNLYAYCSELHQLV